MKVRELLARKGRHPQTIGGDESVDRAIEVLNENRVGALLVLDLDRPLGIITERDILHCRLKFPDRAFTAVAVREVMSSRLIVVAPDEDLSAALTMMLQADIRHLPVIEENRLVGVLSIRDLAQQVVAELNAELHTLHDYLADLQNAGID